MQCFDVTSIFWETSFKIIRFFFALFQYYKDLCSHYSSDKVKSKHILLKALKLISILSSSSTVGNSILCDFVIQIFYHSHFSRSFVLRSW